MNFSQRNGYEQPIPIQFESMNDELKNRLWNAIKILFKTLDGINKKEYQDEKITD